ncbi:hypothetical protein [Actinomadura sp. WMMA1423]|uniref:hypothetical protein n=1 Tax=Actinomadura sp. WMMA1423 TaxID=2591108 RepID=UPI00143DA611|nr:hypothetical protein [Actinomadura sp. WMMA1423]
MAYTLPRLADVALGLVVGLGVNAVVFPPLYLRPQKELLRLSRLLLDDLRARRA